MNIDFFTPEVIIGIAAIFVAVAIGIFTLYFQRIKKSFSYFVLSQTPLLTVKEEVKGDIHISFKNMNIQDLYLVVINFWNSGNVPIEPSDFEKCINLSFGDDSIIISVDILEKSPESLDPQFFIEENNVLSIMPLLLNSQDSFTFKFLITKFKSITITSRIKGIKNINYKLLDPFIRRSFVSMAKLPLLFFFLFFPIAIIIGLISGSEILYATLYIIFSGIFITLLIRELIKMIRYLFKRR